VAQTLTPLVSDAEQSLKIATSPVQTQTHTQTQTATETDCTPPDWAVKIGHAEMWKLHHNCN
jgi:hypothetical protein